MSSLHLRSGKKRRADDSDDLEEKTAGLPVFTPITAPSITKTSHEYLVNWRKERREYEEQIRMRCQTTGESEADLMKSIKNSIKDGLLEVLCKFRWRVAKEDLTDERAIQEIEKIISSVKNSSLPDIRSLFYEELKYDLKETDVNERVLQYFKQCNDIIEDHGLADCFEGDGGEKEKCTLLVSCLQPSELREEVETVVRFQKRSAQRNEIDLYDTILEIALEQEKSFHRRKRSRREEEKALPPAIHSKNPAGKKPIKSKKVQWTTGGTSGSADSKPIPAKNLVGPAEGCLKCGGNHWLSKCASASDAEKLSMPKEHAAKKAMEKSERLKQGKSNLRRLKECIPSVAKNVTLNGKLQVPYCADSGADRTYLSRYHGMKLLELDSTASFYDLPEPVISMAAGGNELISRQAMHVNIMITTAAGIVTISEPWECLILDSAELR
jgi:hypothetical protein